MNLVYKTIVGLAWCCAAVAGESETSIAAESQGVYVPAHASPEWRQLFDGYQPHWNVPAPEDLEAWTKWDNGKQAAFIRRDTPLLEQLGVAISEMSLAGVRVLKILPEQVRYPNKALVYMHGGAWASFSPESTLIDTVPMADQLGIPVFAVDYRKIPFVTIYDVIDENVRVFSALVDELGFKPTDLGLYGCSAGGHLSLAVPNALRNRGIGLPGAAVASSPMVDFTLSNDTWYTLEGDDPLISREAYVRKLLPALGVQDFRDPVISPQFDPNLGDGMPPTLIQTGGKEVLLGDSLVIFQALEAAGQTAKLDVYDGMPHCFPFVLPNAKESKVAFAKQAAWFRDHLDLN